MNGQQARKRQARDATEQRQRESASHAFSSVHIDLEHVPTRVTEGPVHDAQALGLWPGQGRLLRGSRDTLYLVDGDTGSSHSAIALEGVSLDLEAWLRTIDHTAGMDRLLWDADSHGLDLNVAGAVLRQPSELGALRGEAPMRESRPIRVAVVGDVPECYSELFSDWSMTMYAPWRRSSTEWNQAKSWDRVSEIVDQVVRSDVDLVIAVASSTVFDALDLSFLRNLRQRRIPHLAMGVSRSRAVVGPFVDFVGLQRNRGVAGVCSDCLAQAQVDADPDWSSLLAHSAFVREPAMAPGMLRLAFVEAGRWVTRWWFEDPKVGQLTCGQLVTGRQDVEWAYASLGASGSCPHGVGGL